jgi:hypothetical protein
MSATHLGNYKDAFVNGGDVADWASQSNTVGLPSGVHVYDAYDAFALPGYDGDVLRSDILELAALGYKLAQAEVAAA